MRIDDNAEALAMMKRALGSLESKFREAYNKGYKDGVKSMVAEDEPNSSEKPNNYEPQTDDLIKQADDLIAFEKEWLEMDDDCLTCRYNSDEWDSPKCDGCSKAHSNYEPQTERCPHCGDGVITKGQTTCPICGEPQTELTTDCSQTDCAWK